jgi:hypothetical protein
VKIHILDITNYMTGTICKDRECWHTSETQFLSIVTITTIPR